MQPYPLKFDIHCCWAFEDNYHLIPYYDVIVVVDVLLFSTKLDLAINNDEIPVKDFFYQDSTIRVVDSPKISSSFTTGLVEKLSKTDAFVLFGCLRNAKITAQAARLLGKKVLILPIGERIDGEMKACAEDTIGAGAIISYLQQNKISPESQGFLAVYNSSKRYLKDVVMLSGKAKELVLENREGEIEEALKFNKSKFVPMLNDNSVKVSPSQEPVLVVNN